MKRRHFIKRALALTGVCCVLFLRTAIAADADLLTAIRDDDISTVRRLLASSSNLTPATTSVPPH
jgi:hypothetical protein